MLKRRNKRQGLRIEKICTVHFVRNFNTFLLHWTVENFIVSFIKMMEGP